jgi:hypothetical protein
VRCRPVGKRLDQLDLGESGPATAGDLARSRLHVEALRVRVLDMLESGKYDFAWGFLKTLSLDLERLDHVTPNQIAAVDNIEKGGDRHQERLEGWERHEKRVGRRYEGYDRSNR